MDEELGRRAHAVLMQAIEVEDHQREAFLSSACAGDAELRQRVSRLLAAMEHSTHFLETPALGTRPGGEPVFPREPLKSVGDYRIVRVIGVGGMATVYEAIQQEPRRRVALKIMRQGLAHTSAVNRFKYESDVLAHIQHPGIVQIFEAGAWDDGHGVSTPFFVMEYVADARTITDYADERDLSLVDRLTLFLTVCEAVQFGHQHGVIHRDLKPGNVLVDATGRAKVIDFGVARSVDRGQAWATRQTSAGQLIGTLNYMSPEQCSGTDLDIRTDVYSLGIILYELVCGRLPHDLSRVPVPEALRIICDDAPLRPASLDPRLRGDIDAIVMMAIDKDPDRRYPTVAALMADIRRHLADETIEARPPTMMHQCRRFIRRNRGLVAAFSLALLILMAGATVSTVLAWQKTQESRRRQAAEARAIAERDSALWQSYIANIAGGFAALYGDEYQRLRTRLAAAPAEHRGWEWGFLSGMAERSERTISAHDDMVFGFAVSRDGSRLATGSRDGTLRLWNAENGEKLAELAGTPDSPVFSVAFSSDGGLLASGSGNGAVKLWRVSSGAEICELGEHRGGVERVAFGAGGLIATAGGGITTLWDADSCDSRQKLDDGAGGGNGVTFSDDGRHLLTWNRRGSLCMRNTETLEVEQRFSFTGQVEYATFSADAGCIAAGGIEGRVMIWSSRTGEVIHSLTMPQAVSTVRALAFSRCGGRLAVGQGHRGIAIWSVADGEIIESLRGHEEAVSGLSFSRDDQRLFSASWDRTVRVWRLDPDGAVEGVMALAGHEDHVLALAYAPDGSTLVSGGRDKTVRLWEPELGLPLAVLRGHTGAIMGVAFSPDGGLIASGSTDRTVRLWSAETGAHLATLVGSTNSVWSVSFSPDGRRLASGGDDRLIRLWDLESRTQIREFAGHQHRVIRAVFSPDGKRLASVSRDETVRLWDADSGELLHALEGHRSDVFGVTFSPDGRLLYSGARDQTVRVWDPDSGKCLKVLGGHGQFVTSLSISADRQRLAGGSWLGEVTLWDLATHDLVASFKAHEQPIRSVAFAPRGTCLATSSYDSTIRFLDAAPVAERRAQRLAAEARHDAARRLIEKFTREYPDRAGLLKAVEQETAATPEVRSWARRLLLIAPEASTLAETPRYVPER